MSHSPLYSFPHPPRTKRDSHHGLALSDEGSVARIAQSEEGSQTEREGAEVCWGGTST